MKKFDYSKYENLLLPQNLVTILAKIKSFKGKKYPFVGEAADIKHFKPLKSLIETVRIQSTISSSRIEGIRTSEKQILDMIKNDSFPISHDAQEVRGLLELNALISNDFQFITCNVNPILQLHKELYKYTGRSYGGKFKNIDNTIIEKKDGNERIRFKPLSAFGTKEAMEKLCIEYNKAIELENIDSLFLIPVFILDFLCIHPFNDGNGRMSRALTSLLLFRAGYLIGMYNSIEKIIETTKEDYYIALEKSSMGWHENNNDVLPFVQYFLSVLYSAYIDFINQDVIKAGNKQEQIKKFIENKIGKVTKSEIKEALPLISISMIEITLKDLLDKKIIKKMGSGKTTFYIKNGE